MKLVYTISLLLLLAGLVRGQGRQEKQSNHLVYSDFGYGFETNNGNNGFLLGAGYQRNLSRKFIFQLSLQNFRTGIINHNWQYKKYFPKEERYNHSSFLSATLGYTVIGKADRFNVALKGGVTVGYIKSKTMFTYQANFYPEGSVVPDHDPGFVSRENFIVTSSGMIVYGTVIVIPSSVRYNSSNYVGLGYNFGVDVNFPFRKNQVVTLGYAAISQDNPIQFLFFPIPMISYKVML